MKTDLTAKIWFTGKKSGDAGDGSRILFPEGVERAMIGEGNSKFKWAKIKRLPLPPDGAWKKDQ